MRTKKLAHALGHVCVPRAHGLLVGREHIAVLVLARITNLFRVVHVAVVAGRLAIIVDALRVVLGRGARRGALLPLFEGQLADDRRALDTGLFEESLMQTNKRQVNASLLLKLWTAQVKQSRRSFKSGTLFYHLVAATLQAAIQLNSKLARHLALGVIGVRALLGVT